MMTLFCIPTDKLKPNPNNDFLPLPPDEYEDLKSSIEQHGIREPLTVITDGNGYLILAGHNRWNVAKDLSLETIPCFVTTPDMLGVELDTEIFRRMLTKQERNQFKELRDHKRKVSLDSYFQKHLIPEVLRHYQEAHISLELAADIAQWSQDKQHEFAAATEQVVVECASNEQDKKNLEAL
ncbi:MAG: ParB/RepB/Spo0J family partition protein, partial [Nitrospirota bacterium]|nr:ParB/RepB/Spo0J family partition protein [Nitrospirota bacterium]